MSQSKNRRPSGSANRRTGSRDKPVRVPGRGGSTRTVKPPEEVGPTLLVDSVSPLARVAGGLAVLAALTQLVGSALPLAAGPDGQSSGGGGDVGVVLVAAAVLGVAGVLCALGRIPRLGLAAIAVLGGCALGQGVRLITLYTRTGDVSRDLPLDPRVFPWDADTGAAVLLVGYGLAALALATAVLAWSRTWMEDDGGFEARRPLFGGLGLLVGVLAAVGLCMAPGDSDLDTLGPASVVNQHQPAQAGTILLAAVLVLAAVTAATLKPRLATVGAYAGVAAVMLTETLRAFALIGRVPGVGVGVGTVLMLFAAVVFCVLAVAAWRISPPAEEDEHAARGRPSPA